jgi:hypothetical protein
VEKVVRHFPQTKPIDANAKGSKTDLSDDFLDAVSISFIIYCLIVFVIVLSLFFKFCKSIT